MVKEWQIGICMALAVLFVLSASVAVAQSPSAQSQSAQGGSTSSAPAPTPPVASHIESTSVGRYVATLTYSYSAPNEHARQWLIFAPSPPDLPSQNNVSVDVSVLNADGSTLNPISELSPEQRSLLQIIVPVQHAELASGFTVRWVCEATLFQRKLVPGPPSSPVIPLTGSEKAIYLEATPTIDCTADNFRQWLSDNSLLRKSDETDIGFARRVFDFLCAKGTYDYVLGQDRTASKICQTCKTDCGGFSFLYCAILRASGVPARALVGRIGESGVGTDTNGASEDAGQTHVKAEFYADGVGWVPVDVSDSLGYKAAGKTGYFGIDYGHFVTMEVDPDMVVNTFLFGNRTIPHMQAVNSWATGSGSFDGASDKSTWKVAPAS